MPPTPIQPRFGNDIIPRLIDRHRIFAYPFHDVKTRAQSYWRDVGTVDAYFRANLELVYVHPELNLYDAEWPIWTYQEQLPPAKFVLDDSGRIGMATNSMVSGGCIVSGAYVNSPCSSPASRSTRAAKSSRPWFCRRRESVKTAASPAQLSTNAAKFRTAP